MTIICSGQRHRPKVVALAPAIMQAERTLRLLQSIELLPEDIHRLTGFTLRQIQYWRRIGYIKPSKTTAKGYSRFTYREVIKFRIVKWLMGMGFSTQVIFGAGPKDEKALLTYLEAVMAKRHRRLSEHTLYVLPERPRKTVLALLGEPDHTRFHPSQKNRWQRLSFKNIERQTLEFMRKRSPELFAKTA
ncbi:MerR family transcriptional regulator [Candidatus Uhrbacteria bacterium]|nr:MerR family transcriptional regulator [Candidatus Uhrbacteria bacterium]